MNRFVRCVAGLLVGLVPLSSVSGAFWDDMNLSFGEDARWDVYGEYLYWKVAEEQLNYATLLPGGVSAFGNVQPNSTVNVRGKVKSQDADWHSGFRIGAGYSTTCSDWDAQLFWTRLHFNQRNSVKDNAGGVLPLESPVSLLVALINGGQGVPTFANHAKSHWRFDFDTIDFEIGKTLHCGCDAIVRVDVGIRGAFINQHLKTTYQGLNVGSSVAIESEVSKKNDFCSVGPTIGIDAAWQFCPEWTLATGASVGWLYGKFDLGVNSKVTAEGIGGVIDVGVHENKHRLRPTLDGYLGLAWDTCLCDKWNVDLGIFYEYQYWWNQWQTPGSVVFALIDASSTPQGDLSLQGLTVKAGITF